MTLSANWLAAPFALTLASCVANDGKFDVRPIANPIAAAKERGSPMVQEGRSLLAMGSIGLALEAFRKSLRDDPASNVQALAGIAACYERMGRWDLARANYEAALAIEPTNEILLNTFAASLDQQGRHREATALRAEIARRDALAVGAAADEIAVSASAQAPVPAPPRAVPSPVVAGPPALNSPLPPPSVTVPLPAPRIATGQAIAARPEATPPPPATAGPRLERTSLGEVALVTTDQPLWRPQVIARSQQSVTVKFVPLRPAYRETRVRLLNAARHEGLAARTRLALGQKGWNRVLIGDAGRVRERSLVLYSTESAEAARRLAAEFGFGIARDPRAGVLTVLLGRDAARRTIAKS